MLSSIIIGGGPGGMGPLLWAAQSGTLPEWLAQGIAVIDRRQNFGGTLGRFAINSDSLGGAYLECLEAGGTPDAMRRLLQDPVTQQLAVYRNGFPPLRLVNVFLHRLGAVLEHMAGAAPGCAFHRGTDARALHVLADGSVRVETQQPDGSKSSILARSAVVALGGRQSWWERPLVEGMTLADCGPANLMPSDRLLSSDGLQQAMRLLSLAPGRPVVILGGAHSAYSAAWALSFLLPANAMGGRPVSIVQRREPKIFYSDRAAAEADSYPVTPGDLCPRTQRVHRLGGLRGDGRDMWRIVTGRMPSPTPINITRHSLAELSAGDLRHLLSQAALVIPAFGYSAQTLPIYDPRGQRLALHADAGGDAVDQQCRILLKDGRALANVYGIGLGSGFRPYDDMGGEPNFNGQANSLWLYQNGIGATIHRNIQHRMNASQPGQPIVAAQWPGAADRTVLARPSTPHLVSVNADIAGRFQNIA